MLISKWVICAILSFVLGTNASTLENCKNQCISNYDGTLEKACVGACEYSDLLQFNKNSNINAACESECSYKFFSDELKACKKGCGYATASGGTYAWLQNQMNNAYNSVANSYNWFTSKVHKFFKCLNSKQETESETTMSVTTTRPTVQTKVAPLSKQDEEPQTIFITRLRILVFGPSDENTNNDSSSVLISGLNDRSISTKMSEDHHVIQELHIKRPLFTWLTQRIVARPVLLFAVSIMLILALATLTVIVILICHVGRERRRAASDLRGGNYARLPSYDEIIIVEDEDITKKRLLSEDTPEYKEKNDGSIEKVKSFLVV